MVTHAPDRASNQADTAEELKKVRVFSGIQPSGNFHLGNYLGAIRNWVNQIENSDSIFCVVDLHALSNNPDPDVLQQQIRNVASSLLASGLDPQKCLLFVQSDVPAHAELQWLLNSVTQFGELRRMTQFKDKSAGKGDSVSAVVFSYPVLMAADIVLYDAEEVPVGDDQRQHVELTRDIVQRFNARYGETFVVPKADIKEEAARIMALDKPDEKMSKSSPRENSYVAFSDPPDVIRKKIRRAVTDSGETVTAGPDKPALTNLIQIYGSLTGMTPSQVEAHFEGKRYGDFKKELADVVVDRLAPIQAELTRLNDDAGFVAGVLQRGAEQANDMASGKMGLVRERMGIGRPRP
ncbi:MAG TPA: tryptophan--tRNA ligase [Thermomicrobiales bacterium]|nr:tryptophan--tRNA ligase [Thermomicrobiales bacterium]